MMEYGILTLGEIEVPYTWRFDDLESAKAAALELSQEHHVEVVVFRIVGSYQQHTLWVEKEEEA